MSITRKEVIETFKKAIDFNQETDKPERYFIAVAVELPDTETPEIIINPPENLKRKLTYYMHNYDMDMRLNANPDVQIVDCEACCSDGDFVIFIETHAGEKLYSAGLHGV